MTTFVKIVKNNGKNEKHDEIIFLLKMGAENVQNSFRTLSWSSFGHFLGFILVYCHCLHWIYTVYNVLHWIFTSFHHLFIGFHQCWMVFIGFLLDFIDFSMVFIVFSLDFISFQWCVIGFLMGCIDWSIVPIGNVQYPCLFTKCYNTTSDLRSIWIAG